MKNMGGVIFREDTVQFELDQIKEHFETGGIFTVFDDKISIGYMVAATNLSNFIIAPCQVLSQNYARIKASKKIREKIENLMIGKSVEDERKEPLTYVKKGRKWENVNFQYEENQKID